MLPIACTPWPWTRRAAALGGAWVAAALAGCGGGQGASVTPPPPPPTEFNVGFRIVNYAPGLKAAVWYPTRDAPGQGIYPSGLTTDHVSNGTVADVQNLPLVVFSHGDGGCGTQSVVLAERLARKGFVFAAPDHRDALCSVDGGPARGPDPRPSPSFSNPEFWSDLTHVSRRDEIRSLTDHLLANEPFRSRIDTRKLALAGHSLGGYSALAMAGAWGSWQDPRFKAALLLSPYLLPFLEKSTLPAVTRPVMYQGGTADVGITPFIKGPAGSYPAGAYTLANPPKIFLEIQGAGHFAWTNSVCPVPGSVAQCLQAVPFVPVYADYAVAFFRRHLDGVDQPLLRTADPLFASFRYDE